MVWVPVPHWCTESGFGGKPSNHACMENMDVRRWWWSQGLWNRFLCWFCYSYIYCVTPCIAYHRYSAINMTLNCIQSSVCVLLKLYKFCVIQHFGQQWPLFFEEVWKVPHVLYHSKSKPHLGHSLLKNSWCINPNRVLYYWYIKTLFYSTVHIC